MLLGIHTTRDSPSPATWLARHLTSMVLLAGGGLTWRSHPATLVDLVWSCPRSQGLTPRSSARPGSREEALVCLSWARFPDEIDVHPSTFLNLSWSDPSPEACLPWETLQSTPDKVAPRIMRESRMILCIEMSQLRW